MVETTFTGNQLQARTTPCEMIVIPAAVPRAWKNRNKAGVRLIAAFVPSGIEELFTRPAGQSLEQIVALAAQYGLSSLVLNGGLTGHEQL